MSPQFNGISPANNLFLFHVSLQRGATLIPSGIVRATATCTWINPASLISSSRSRLIATSNVSHALVEATVRSSFTTEKDWGIRIWLVRAKALQVELRQRD